MIAVTTLVFLLGLIVIRALGRHARKVTFALSILAVGLALAVLVRLDEQVRPLK